MKDQHRKGTAFCNGWRLQSGRQLQLGRATLTGLPNQPGVCLGHRVPQVRGLTHEFEPTKSLKRALDVLGSGQDCAVSSNA